jgi:NADH-quinone oxidoreductase subunit K
MIYYLALGGMLFFIGLFGVLTRRRIASILLSLELMCAGAVLNCVVFNRYLISEETSGYQLAFVVAVIALVQVFVAAIWLRLIPRQHEPTPTDQDRLFRW